MPSMLRWLKFSMRPSSPAMGASRAHLDLLRVSSSSRAVAPELARPLLEDHPVHQVGHSLPDERQMHGDEREPADEFGGMVAGKCPLVSVDGARSQGRGPLRSR